MPYLDVVGAGLGDALYPYIEASRAKWAILDGSEPFVRENVLSLYDYAGPVPVEVQTMIGFPSAPRLLFKRHEPEPKPDLRVVFDFETPSYAGWTVTGNAFGSSPTAGKPPDQLAIVGYRGRGLANSYALRLGDAATGMLFSPPFTLDRSHLALLVGGAAGRATRAELIVDGEAVVEASGPGGDVMVPVFWDVSALEGRRAQLPPPLKHEEREEGLAVVSYSPEMLVDQRADRSRFEKPLTPEPRGVQSVQELLAHAVSKPAADGKREPPFGTP
jgi:hypothetical protein